MNCPKCGSTQLTTGCKALSARLQDWFHRCLDCGFVIPIGLRYQSTTEDTKRAERRAELLNKAFELNHKSERKNQ